MVTGSSKRHIPGSQTAAKVSDRPGLWLVAVTKKQRPHRDSPVPTLLFYHTSFGISTCFLPVHLSAFSAGISTRTFLWARIDLRSRVHAIPGSRQCKCIDLKAFRLRKYQSHFIFSRRHADHILLLPAIPEPDCSRALPVHQDLDASAAGRFK